MSTVLYRVSLRSWLHGDRILRFHNLEKKVGQSVWVRTRVASRPARFVVEVEAQHIDCG